MTTTLDIETAFAQTGSAVLELRDARRLKLPSDPWGNSLLDQFPQEGASCLFLSPPQAIHYQLRLPGRYGIQPATAGGWWLRPMDTAHPTYWLPVAPALRRMDELGRIFEEAAAPLQSFDPGHEHTQVTLGGSTNDLRLHLCLWRLPDTLIRELNAPRPIEGQGWFSLGSHTNWRRPADLYTHLEQGWIHENRRSWPQHCRICSENDAHALYLLCKGLAGATGKAIYQVFQRQILLAVIHRQDERGGWRHGEWSRDESHFRLVTSGLHLLMDAWAEASDPRVGEAMDAAARFLGERSGRIRFGTWFPHDELELSEESIAHLPFPWSRSTVLGKTVSNMLVLNTHLDTTIALHRHASLSGCRDYQDAVSSALDTTEKLLGLSPLEPLYRLLFLPLRLSLLPTARARALPLPLRALKRLGWKYIAPNLYRIKARFPRFVMPGGFIERDICMRNWSFFYLTINLMDLARLQLAFPQADLHLPIRQAEAFTESTGVLDRWAELGYERHALGFWAESLYYLWRLEPSHERSRRLADAMVRLHRLDMGLPPSLLGGNGEVVPPDARSPYPDFDEPGLRLANLGDRRQPRFLAVNCGDNPIDLSGDLGAMERLDGASGILTSGEWVLLATRPNAGQVS